MDDECGGQLPGAGEFDPRADTALFYLGGHGIGDLHIHGGAAVFLYLYDGFPREHAM
jgi:hypothetical protein